MATTKAYTFGKDDYAFVMNSGNFKIFRKITEEEKQLQLFCTDCDCEEGCICEGCDCDAKNRL